MELMTTELLAGIQVWHVVFGAIGLLVVLMVLQSLLRKKDVDDSLNVRAWCGACGWKGSASKYQRKCPRCGGELQKHAA